ncbi:LLM class flavin-dependent oxidoreductase [Kribbella jejuensis]|uniref:Alkanesulfonate monooxygenase SsuD/methylene tetrahydromethanopterin reductase-like flavin-dependent oxidoreductase (Luciferase family) n=1 Tax=Kribbella jejuensis TaxID=236068 RepID=A0A542ERV4_9ACTN|nr:LLM class flavin-dependent oxidoreductase [Kribbella jejuensis]TQJ18070.1 alkanesulfonate monooxygenase SsuD/methylene tetrahydromethanopterin reductase-like flavin-dependent oxidoreductase (luciferase family) [Kribbella jejuensis]
MIIGLEIDGAGADPAAWRGAEVDPRALLTGELAVRAAQRAEAAGIDFVTFADALEAPEDVPDRVSVRLDALGLAARVAPVTERIGLLPTITVTHTEPFHVQASVATLDHISGGRAGWVVEVSTSGEAAAVIGRREPASAAETWREARYVVDVSRRLWDSWEDDAIIRDASTGRYVDRERLHYVDFSSPTFSVKGPSIVPRPPQGHPVTAVFVRTPEALEAARDAELVLLPDSDEVAAQLQALRTSGIAAEGSRSVPVIVVSLPVEAEEVGALVEEIGRWAAAGIDGVHLRPASLELDVPVIADQVLPELRARGLTGPADRGGSLRGRLGLGRPRNTFSGSAR